MAEMTVADTPTPVEQVPVTPPTPQPTGPEGPTAPLPDSRPMPAPAAPPAVVGASEPKHALLGRAFHALAGEDINYTTDANGQTKQVVTPRTPGSFFKSIVAGALLGGALGAEKNTFAGGAAAGGEGVQQNMQRQDLLRRQQASDQFKLSQEAQRTNEEKARTALEGRRVTNEEDRVKQEKVFNDAQIAHLNTQNLELLSNIQGKSFTEHLTVAERGKIQAAPYERAGIDPIQKDVSESQAKDMLAKDPALFTKLQWIPVDVKPVRNADGHDSYEMVYNAYDANKPVTITDAERKMFAESGLDDFKDPKVKKEYTASQYAGLLYRADSMYKTTMDRQMLTANLKKENAQIDEAKAHTTDLLAQAKERSEQKKTLLTQQAALGKMSEAVKKYGSTQTAFDSLAFEDKSAIASYFRPLAEDARKATDDAYKQYEAATKQLEPNQTEVAKMLQNYKEKVASADAYSRMSNLFAEKTKNPPSANPKINSGNVDKALNAIESLPMADREAAVRAATTLTPEEKDAVLQGIKAFNSAPSSDLSTAEDPGEVVARRSLGGKGGTNPQSKAGAP